MEEFLGVLFCGGRGTRLGKISEYISKPLVPVYDKPVFMFGLEQLQRSKLISSILILTNKENDKALRKAGYTTLIQNDKHVRDMYSGWEFIKKETRTTAHGVLVPSDNISDIKIDPLIRKFIKLNADFVFSISKNISRAKLLQMGNYDPRRKIFEYKPSTAFEYGVIAPFVVRNTVKIKGDKELFESSGSHHLICDGMWNDIGDPESLAEAVSWRRKNI